MGRAGRALPSSWKLFTAASFGLGGLGLLLFLVLRPTDDRTRKDQTGDCTLLNGRNGTEEPSCKNFDGCHGFCPGNECQCTSQCINVGNCCEDFAHMCLFKDDAHTKLIKLEDEIHHLEHGEGIVGSEWILGLVMVFFIVTMMVLVCMSHNTDRKKLKVEEMTCKTTSVFAANTFSVALHGVLIQQIVMGKHPGLDLPAGPIRIAQIYGVVAVLLFLLSNALIYRFKDTRERFFAICQLSSHMIAFTLVRALGSLQWSAAGLKQRSGTVHGSVLPWAAVLLRGSVFVGERLRAKYIRRPDEVQWEYRKSGKHWRRFPFEIDRQIEAQWSRRSGTDASDTEDSDQSGQSGLVSYVSGEGSTIDKRNLVIVFDPDDPDATTGKPREFQVRLPDTDVLFADPCGLMFRTGEEEEWKVRWQCPWHHFAEEAFLDGAGLVMGFLMMQLVLYIHTGYLHSTEGLLLKPDAWDWPLTLMVLAWSCGFVALVIVVERSTRCLPGWMAPDLEMLSGSFSAAFGWCLLRCAGLMVLADAPCTLMDTYVIVAFPLTWLAFLSIVLANLVLPRLPKYVEAEEVQHCIASAAAIVVGLAWDKAFESLTVHMTRGWNGHYVIAKARLSADAQIPAIVLQRTGFGFLGP
ncbi:unnamed protein product [Symbiodinium necroappetens]|uniref:SMB domain-containing protein n=1 Tax=Symbiodinium necroappetens TaxID=1628268 RepID=A0A812UI84_9DINO|nr:unnamed protein product [Symbiodinium necroappetens]